MNDDILRHQVKLLKALQGVSYKQIAEEIGIKPDSLCSWLRCNYSFSDDRIGRLKQVIEGYKDIRSDFYYGKGKFILE